MSLMGYTSGGSPIFGGVSSKRATTTPYKKYYICSLDSKHKLTKNQAKASGGFCVHCGAWLQEYKPVIRKNASDLENKIYDLQMELEMEKMQGVIDRRNAKKMKAE